MQMRRITFVASFIILTFLACKPEDDDGTPMPSPETPPNILLVIADDLGLDATPGYNIGAQKPLMPHLSELAARGITFDNVWAYPMCSPTRAAILTGRYGYRTGVLNATDNHRIDASEKTLQQVLDEQTGSAYSHAIIGKWHLSANEPERPQQMGIGYYAGILGGGVSDYEQWSLSENGTSSTETSYVTTKLTDLAIDWIGQQDKAWFCWLAYNAPHTPFHLPPAELHSQGSLPADQASIDANPLPYYLAMVESVDHELGRLLSSLSTEEMDNTLIIFVGDNGTPGQVAQSPYGSMQAKGSLFQGGVHVPMIIAGKGVERMNARESSLIQVSDLFTSIAEMAGASLPAYEDSFSFYPLLKTGGSGARAYNYSEILNVDMPARSGYTIRNEAYKLIVLDNGGRRLYDLSADPYEQTNLLSGTLTAGQTEQLTLLEEAAAAIRE